MSRTNFDQLLEAGCHFGHLRRKWNPAMAPYIFMERNGIHIIDLHKTVAKVDEASVPEAVKEEEYKVAVQKTKEEQVEKAVEVALKKAGLNPNHFDSEDHIESNQGKGWITAEDVAKFREIKETVSAEKAANLNENMIQNIAKGRVGKFLKENCLVCQEFQFGDGDKQSVADYLKKQDKELKIVAYKRFTLAAE